MEDRVPRINRSCRKKRSIDSSFYLERAKNACMKNEISLAHKNFVLYFESLENPLEAPVGVQKVFTKLVCKIGSVLEAMCNIEELLKYYIQALNFFPDNYMILTNLGAYMFKVNEIDIARRYLERAVKVNKDYLPAGVNLMHVKWHQIPRWHFRMLNDKRRNLAYDKAIAQQISLGYKDVFDIGSGCGLLSLSASRHENVNVTAIEENKILFNMSEEIFSANGFTKVKKIQMNSNYITEPPDKCNLLVTEVFDVALFGEKALDTILHALTVLRTEDDFKIIPYRAKVYVAGISSAELLAKHEVTSAATLRLLDLPNVTIRVHDPEPYEAEHLPERRDVAYLTRPLEIIDVDFRDAEQLYYVLYGHDELECQSTGVVHAFAVWFDLFLTEDVRITTNPFDENRVVCWEQAVIYLDRPVQVKEGDKLPISFSVQDSKLSIMHLNCEKDPRLQFRVSKEIISFLNDEGLVDTIVQMSQKIRLSDIVVVDYNPVPLLGILLAKHRNCKVYHTVRDGTDKLFIDYVVTHNNVPLERFVLLDDLEMSVEQQKCLLFLDVVDCDGSLGSSVYRIAEGEAASVRVPQAVDVYAQLIYSPYLDFCNRVADENVLDFRIGEFMNEYSGYEHPNLEKFAYSERSEPVTFPLGYNGQKTKEVIVTEAGLVNALYVWYEFQFFNDVTFCTKDSTHYKKTCFFLSSPKSVEKGDRLCIKMDVHDSDMKFSL